jgi:hypothetical protein
VLKTVFDVRIGEVRLWGGERTTNSTEKPFREKNTEKANFF